MKIRPYDGVRLPFEDKSFDFVCATHILEHVLNERRFLQELGRVTKTSSIWKSRSKSL